MDRRIRIAVQKEKILWGFVMVLAGVLAPMAVNVGNLEINSLLYASIAEMDTGKLVLAAFKLVILNSVRALPHYLGAFIIAESITVAIGGKSLNWLRGLGAILIVPLVYRLIYHLHGFSYDFGMPAFIALMAIILIENLNYSNISIAKKAFVFILLLLGVQWLDVIPALSRFGFGRGEVSADVKLIAGFIGADEVLTFAGITFLAIFIMNALLINKILSDEQRLIITMEKNKEIEKGLEEVRLKSLQARTDQEIQSLVHDLKTPLTAIQALAGVSEMMAADERLISYMSKIADSVDNMNRMISEILYEDNRGRIAVSELFDYVFSQIPSNDCKNRIRFENMAEGTVIKANKIRLSRAIINIIMNAYEAIDRTKGRIRMECGSGEDVFYIAIEDDGVGIGIENIGRVFDMGYSTKNSTGLGLSFARNVVERHGGRLEIESRPNRGTKIVIILPKGE